MIEDNVKELKKAAEEQDRRRWQLIILVIGSVVTSAFSIALAYLKTIRP